MTTTTNLLLAGIFTVSLATAAAAQTTGAQTTPMGPWTLSISAQETYEDNVQLTAQGTGTLGTNLGAALGRDWMFPRGDVRLSGNVNQLFYHETPELNQPTFGLTGGASYAISRRFRWTITDTVSEGYAQDSRVLINQGVVLPKVVTLTNVASNQLSYDLSPRSQIQWGLSTQRVVFTTTDFIGGNSVTSQLAYSHQIAKSQRLGITQQYQVTFQEGTSAIVQALLGTWQRPIGKDSGVSVGMGVQPYTVPGVSGYHFAPTTSVSVDTHVRRTDTLVLSYNRTVLQTFGVDRTEDTYTVTATYGLNLSRKFGMSFSDTYVRGSDVVVPDRKLIGQTASVSAQYALRQNLAITAGYSVFARTEEPNPTTVASYRASVALAYSTSWR
jgi:hypothetical protein